MRIPTTVIGNGTLAASRVVKAAPCKLISILGVNNGPDQFIQVHETASLPANGAVPVFHCPAFAGQVFSLDFGSSGADLDAVTLCNSTTLATKTIGAANCSFQAILRA